MSTSRPYVSPVREADAAETRGRIVDAAARLFARDGYAGTPLRAIAVEAGVSVQSVHLAGPKPSLLMAAFERTFAGDEGAHSLLERTELAEILTEPDSVIALDRYVEFIVIAHARSAGIWRALRAAAGSDPQVRVEFAAQDARRRSDLLRGAGWFASRGLIPPEDIQNAADVLAYLTSADSYLSFVEESGWSVTQYTRWLRRSLDVQVLAAER